MNKVRRLLPASGIREVFDQVRRLEKAGKEILHLEVGKPEWDMPPGVVTEAQLALDEGFVHYLPNRGIPELYQAVFAILYFGCLYAGVVTVPVNPVLGDKEVGYILESSGAKGIVVSEEVQMPSRPIGWL